MKNHEEIQGWFNYKNVYNFLVTKVPDDGIFVECGAWLGSSSSYLCDIAQDRIKVFIVDTWKGSPDELNSTHRLATTTDIFKIFIDNMGERSFTPIRMDSCEASLQFNNESCDVVYIDMTHTYEAVKRDIECWLPKVKIGGYIAGHDYAFYAPGVIKAVDEFFKDRITIMDDNSWVVKKESL